MVVRLFPGFLVLWYGYQDAHTQGFFWAAYTLNQNIELHTFPVYSVNHPELALPFMDTFLNALPGRIRGNQGTVRLARRVFPSGDGVPRRGAVVRVFISLLFLRHRICLGLQIHAGQGKFRGPELYPFLREVARFFTAFMEKGSDGRYHVPPTVPAEIGTLAGDAIADISLLKPCLELAVEASEMFDLDLEDRTKWREVWTTTPTTP